MASEQIDLYVRISDDLTGEAEGTDRQVAILTEWAAQRGWSITDVYRDDSASATSGTRPAFEALLNRRHHRPVAVYALDRLARLARDMERVLVADFPVYSRLGGDLDLSTVDGRLMARVMTSFATAEIEKKAKRSRDANAARALEGKPYWKRRPFGNNLDGTSVPEEADAIRWAAAEILAGGRLVDVVAEWERRGLRTPQTRGKRSVGGNPWTAAAIHHVLKNPRIGGIRIVDGGELVGTWDAPLDADTFRALAEELAHRSARVPHGRTGRTAANLLTGIARCPKCNKTVQRAGIHYRCLGCGCWNAELAEWQVNAHTVLVLSHPQAQQILQERIGADVQELRNEREQLRHSREEWLTSGLRPVDVAVALRPIDSRIEAISGELVDASRADVFDGITPDATLEDALTIWRALDLGRRRATVEALWSTITADRAGVLLTPSLKTQAILDQSPTLEALLRPDPLASLVISPG